MKKQFALAAAILSLSTGAGLQASPFALDFDGTGQASIFVGTLNGNVTWLKPTGTGGTLQSVTSVAVGGVKNSIAPTLVNGVAGAGYLYTGENGAFRAWERSASTLTYEGGFGITGVNTVTSDALNRSYMGRSDALIQRLNSNGTVGAQYNLSVATGTKTLRVDDLGNIYLARTDGAGFIQRVNDSGTALTLGTSVAGVGGGANGVTILDAGNIGTNVATGDVVWWRTSGFRGLQWFDSNMVIVNQLAISATDLVSGLQINSTGNEVFTLASQSGVAFLNRYDTSANTLTLDGAFNLNLLLGVSGQNPSSLVLGDLDGNGFNDLLVGFSSSPNLYWLKYNSGLNTLALFDTFDMGSNINSLSIASVPEPASAVLVMLGLGGLVLLRRLRNSSRA